MPRPRRSEVVSIGAVAVAVAVGAAPSVSALTRTDRISHAGLGPIKLGMSERQIERAAGRPIKLTSSPGSDCATATLAGKTHGLFTGKRLRRIYIRTPQFATKAGVRVGASEQRVVAAYPDKLARVPQKYAPEEDNLVLRQGTRKIIFTLADGKISEISTGRPPEINLVEGCS